MTAPKNIRYLHRTDVNVDLWNACIEQAPNGLPYAHTFFLDAMCPGWSALVQDNYTAVMPLPRRKKWGIHYLYHPFLTPALGVFCTDKEIINTDLFLKAIPAGYRLWDLTLNAANTVHAYSKWAIARTNYLLPLGTKYEHIQNSYHHNIRRDLQKALKAGLVIKTSVPVTEIIAIAAQQYPHFTNVADRAFDRVHEACKKMTGHIGSYGVYNKQGALIASCVLLLFRNRLIYWLPANRPESRTCGASAFLIDHIIKDYAGLNMVFDFEGSDDAGVGRFYRHFGAVEEQYTSLYYNKLAFPFLLLKRMPAHYRQIIFNNTQKQSF